MTTFPWWFASGRSLRSSVSDWRSGRWSWCRCSDSPSTSCCWRPFWRRQTKTTTQKISSRWYVKARSRSLLLSFSLSMFFSPFLAPSLSCSFPTPLTLTISVSLVLSLPFLLSLTLLLSVSQVGKVEARGMLAEGRPTDHVVDSMGWHYKV